MNQSVPLSTLKGIEFLRGVSEEHLEQIAAISRVREYEEQQVAFREGDAADCVYLVVSGKLTIELGTSAEDRKRIITLGPGEVLGWSSLLVNHRMAATARALVPTRVVQVDSARLQEICNEDPEFGFAIMRRTTLALAKRLNATWGQLSHMHVSHFLPVAASVEEDEV